MLSWIWNHSSRTKTWRHISKAEAAPVFFRGCFCLHGLSLFPVTPGSCASVSEEPPHFPEILLSIGRTKIMYLLCYENIIRKPHPCATMLPDSNYVFWKHATIICPFSHGKMGKITFVDQPDPCSYCTNSKLSAHVYHFYFFIININLDSTKSFLNEFFA